MIDRVSVTVSSELPSWEEFLARRPSSTVYNNPRWGLVLQRAYGNKAYYLTARRGAEIVGVLALVARRSLLFGSCLCSLPYFDAAGIIAEDQESTERLTLEARALMERLGADCLIVCPSVPYGMAGRTATETEKVVAVVLRRLAPVAQQHGVKLAIEPLHPMYVDYLNTVGATMRLVMQVDHPNVGLMLDVYHVWREENLLDKILRAGNSIVGVHISDWYEPPRSVNDRMVPGEGIIPWKPVLQAIEATGYQGYYDVEIASEELWQGDYVDMLRRCQ